MDDYEKMLESAQKALPESATHKERFEIPKVTGHIQGNKTIISNFLQIASFLHRDAEQMLKFVLRELATPGEIKKSGSVIIGAKVPSTRINEKIETYANTYVFCTECGKPDTKVLAESDVNYLKCMACGSKHPIKSKV